jgi:hypothetical protein
VDKIEMIDDSKDGRFTVSTFFDHDTRYTQDLRELK